MSAKILWLQFLAKILYIMHKLQNGLTSQRPQVDWTGLVSPQSCFSSGTFPQIRAEQHNRYHHSKNDDTNHQHWIYTHTYTKTV